MCLPSALWVSFGTRYQTTPNERSGASARSRPYFPKSPTSPTYRSCIGILQISPCGGSDILAFKLLCVSRIIHENEHIDLGSLVPASTGVCRESATRLYGRPAVTSSTWSGNNAEGTPKWNHS